MVTGYWSADALFRQVSIAYNMDVQYQRSTRLHNQGCISLQTYYLGPPAMAAMLRDSVASRAYAPTSNAAAHDNHEKISSWAHFPYMVMGLRYDVFST